MRITALQQQANDPNRTNIFADGQFLMGVNTLIVLKLNLRMNQELTREQLRQLEQEEALQKALDRALNYLSSRPHSREEVRRYLHKKETQDELIDPIIERLEHMGLINDEQFATFWMESRERFNPKGSRAIKNELRLKGVQREVVDDVVSDEGDEELALRAGRKKAQALARQPGIDFNTFRGRLGPFLQRRGFSYEVVKHAIRTLWEEVAPGEEDTDDDDLDD